MGLSQNYLQCYMNSIKKYIFHNYNNLAEHLEANMVQLISKCLNEAN